MVVLSKHHVGLAGTYRRAATRALNALLLSGAATCAAYADTQVGETLPPPPSVLYGDLFVAVQTAQIYPDQKTFVDATPNDRSRRRSCSLYEQQKNKPGFSLTTFVAQYFTPPTDQVITPPPNQSLREHIDWLWPALTRTTTSVPANSSLIPMPKPYVVPGGRFREGYYWDTYFTMLGLAGSGPRRSRRRHARQLRVSDRHDRPHSERQSHVLREPVAAAVLLLHGRTCRAEGRRARLSEVFAADAPANTRTGCRARSTLQPGDAARNVVMLPDRTVLNRYWDERDTPRDESYLGRRQHRQAGHGPPGERGLSRSARGGRKRLGLQLALVRRQP